MLANKQKIANGFKVYFAQAQTDNADTTASSVKTVSQLSFYAGAALVMSLLLEVADIEMLQMLSDLMTETDDHKEVTLL